MFLEQLSNVNFRFFRAKVTHNKDPKNFGRIKVWIPDIMDKIKPDGKKFLWARPANNPFGAGWSAKKGGGGGQEQGEKKEKDLNDGRKHAGSSHIPLPEQWVWIFFENDNLSRPYYVAALYLESQPILPENTVGKLPFLKWIPLRSAEGRTIFISDDRQADARVMITGRKRDYNPKKPKDTVLKIEKNQAIIGILEDEKKNDDQILLADPNGNYFVVRMFRNKIWMYASSKAQYTKSKEGAHYNNPT